jgi:predicted MFS family arabinose efflux permease
VTVIAHKRALFALFMVPGLALSSWTTRSPAVRDAIEASTAQMGLILLGLSIGSMIGIASSGPLVSRFGTRTVIALGTTLVITSLPVITVTTSSGHGPGVAIGLGVFGLGMGASEVAINIDGSAIEEALDTTILPTIHGYFSLGALLGATAGIAATAMDFPVIWHLLLVSGVGLILLATAIGSLPGSVGRRNPSSEAATLPAGDRRLWRDPRLLLIGVIVLVMAFAEGAGNDWLPLIMIDGHGTDEMTGSLVYALFALSMAVGRFAGGALVDRVGSGRLLTWSAIVGSLGLAALIFGDSPALAAVAVLLWGVGISLGFPLALSAAGRSGPDSAARVSLASTVGYLAFLVGPPTLGILGEEIGLRYAMIAVLVPLAVVGVLASKIERSNRDPFPERDSCEYTRQD